MKISIIGAGYVGLATGACLARFGHEVTFVDSNREKIEIIKAGRSPIYEKGLQDFLNVAKVEATCDLAKAIGSTEVSFVCVGTDNSNDGYSINLQHIKEVARGVGAALTKHHLIVIKSTVIPGTTEGIIIPLLEKNGNRAGSDFQVCVNPEFLREGCAIEDFCHPNRIIIGEINKSGGNILVELFAGFKCPILRFDLRTAEMIKYASNTFLAAKISLINEIGNICKKLDIDVYEVAKGMGYDDRIGAKFLNAGVGFGGSCLPKDLRALITRARELGYEPKILAEVLRLNEEQPQRLVDLLKTHLPNLKGKEIGVLGLAYKANTDDIREAPAIKVVGILLKEGARVKAYDPLAEKNFQRLFPEIQYVTPPEVLNCDAVLVLTDWPEFNDLSYKDRIVIDGRRVLKAQEAAIYEGICW